ncbi:MAG: hypothetical protein J07AB43_13210 [Candidatus Nanosalina sp. J07AB43]|jgi:hypothetical protein|nr:MAG: hypothetical protein J07AB43_13210 [Candidatus Nanosalina sp. J07AB43]
MKDLDWHYNLDSTEFGKILTVFSAALLLFSVYSYYNLGSVEAHITESENQMENGLSFVESPDSQRIIEALSDVRGVSEEFSVLQRGFREAERSLNSTRQAKTAVKDARQRYQWMSVISISSIIAGLAVMVLEIG